MARLVDGRRARTPAGALLELSAMANEKQLLRRELERWGRRHAEIEARLGEIAAKERRLMALVNGVEPAGAGSATAVAAPLGPAVVEATSADLGRRIKVQEISY